MDFNELLAELGSEIGLEEMEPDSNGIVSLDVDGMSVVIAAVSGGDAIVLRGDAGEPPPEAADAVRKLILEGVFAMHSSTGCFLRRTLSPAGSCLQTGSPFARLRHMALRKNLNRL
ncbi:MAG: type III secretion system chaperone [Kiritimatiellae bacterium]|nr:type III secretion system chaperone [Kiritimatiellia bacterium]